VEVTPGFGYSSEILSTIQANIEAYIEGLDIGVDVSATGILTAVTAAIENPARPSFSLGSITLGEEGQTPGIIDVPIAWNAAASVGTVTVTEVT
jgi:hypothetical protein